MIKDQLHTTVLHDSRESQEQKQLFSLFNLVVLIKLYCSKVLILRLYIANYQPIIVTKTNNIHTLTKSNCVAIFFEYISSMSDSESYLYSISSDRSTMHTSFTTGSDTNNRASPAKS